MRLPDYPKSERIGHPELFCGRERELDSLLDWVDGIPEGLSKSQALMATKRRTKKRGA